MSPKDDAPTEVGGGELGAPPAMPEDVPAPTPAGYSLVELLGRGGMGEVVLAEDLAIGRQVALKRMRRADREGEIRFVREAKIQARLQHPAIVPVHALGRDADGRPFFTMKRLVGDTLEHQLDKLPLATMLRAFIEVCQAIELAHANGVIHRDLKPSNIMIGDLGEVYVIDWGVARVIASPTNVGRAATPEAARSTIDEAATENVADVISEAGETQVGRVMGTPGYMAPEQALGYGMEPAIDVYALGCVLFEILTCEPVVPRGTRSPRVTREPPSARRPDLAIAPELDAACVAAMDDDPEVRPSARELAARVGRYLDGDRDLARRRRLAADAIAESRAATDRAEAIRAAGRALALDPDSREAADLVGALILSPPDAPPPELVASLDASEVDANRVRARTAMMGFASVLPFIAVLPFVEVKSWPLFVGFFGAALGMVGISWLSYRRGHNIVWLSLASTLVTVMLLSRFASPFVLTPVVICGVAIGLSSIPWLLERPWIVGAWIVAATAGPYLLEEAGVFSPTWGLEGDHLLVTSQVIHGTHRNIEAFALLAANLVFVAAVHMFARTAIRDRREAERHLHVQAWHLRQLLPR